MIKAVKEQLAKIPGSTVDAATALQDILDELNRTYWDAKDDGGSTDLTSADGKPLLSLFNIFINSEYLSDVRKHLQAKGKDVKLLADLPERDRLMIDMIRGCRDDYDRKADVYFDSIPNMTSASVARKRMVKDMLLQAVMRGLSPEKAEDIRGRLKLPLSTKVQ